MQPAWLLLLKIGPGRTAANPISAQLVVSGLIVRSELPNHEGAAGDARAVPMGGSRLGFVRRISKETVVGLIFRRSRSFGPLRLTLSKRGLGVSAGAGPLRIGRGASGRRTLSVRLLKGFFWRKG